jgi:hypothetical protein
MEQVADLLTRIFPQFNTAASNCLVSDALYQMCSENVDYLIIMEDNKFHGRYHRPRYCLTYFV